MKVSIVIPVYNSEKYIYKCLNSITNQSYKDLEIIVINDGSVDESDNIIKDLKNTDKRIIYIEQKNSGVSAARNLGIKVSTGEYITFIDSDDTVEKDYIELLINEINKKSIDIVACGYTDISIYGAIKLNDFYNGNSTLSKDEFVSNIFNGVGGTLWGKIFKSKIIKENNIKMNENIYMCEDMIFVLQYAMSCISFGAIQDNLYNYNRKNENSISSKMNFNYFNNLVIVMEKIEDILQKSNYNRGFIDSIICERIKSLAFNFSIMQNDKKHNYSKVDRIENLKIIFKNRYFKRYKENFYISGFKEKILLYFIKKEKVKATVYYSYLLFLLDIFKFNLRKSILIGEKNES